MEHNRSREFLAFYFWVKVFLTTLFLAGVWHYLFADRAVVELSVTSNVKSLFKIYYPTANNHWAEQAASGTSVRPGVREYTFRLTNLRNAAKLRIDPTEKEGELIIHSLVLRQYGYKPVDILQLIQQENFKNAMGGEFFATNQGIRVVATTNDPRFTVQLPELQPAADEKASNLFRLFLFFITACFLVKAADRALPHYRFVLLAMLVITVFAAVMAGISQYNTHPDEMVHCHAASFYVDNTLPPAVGDPRGEGTYSPYGYSRLYSRELAYLAAGKFAKLLEPLNIPQYLAFRYFNVTLLATLFFFACTNTVWRIILLPLFLFPQAWYIFSYWNSDALALFLSLCCVWQLVAKESAWNRLIDKEFSFRSLSGGIGPVLLLTALFFCKKNFYFFLLFAALFVLHQLFFKTIPFSKKVIATILAIFLSATTLFGSYLFWDAAQNDFDRENRIQEQVKIHAQPLFNPNTPQEKQFSNLHMKQRGVSFAQMVSTYWGEKSFRTSVGEYGYTSVPGSLNYYNYMRYCLVLLGIAVVCSTVLLKGGWEKTTLLLLTAGSAFSLIAASFYTSWTMDYQAQGRYLLPVIAMLSLFYYSARKQLENMVVVALGALVFCGGIYSFIFVALAGIGKVGIPF